MKKFIIVLSSMILIYGVFIQFDLPSEKPVKKVTISYTWTRIQSHGSNQIAIWVEDTLGNYVCSLFATNYTVYGGYIQRPLSLSEWVTKFDLKNASKEQIDAVSGSTPQSGIQSHFWNCTDQSGQPVPDGFYVIRMEANIHDADKMFYKGIIKIGGSDQQITGEISYSDPVLASGNVLFKDVLVEYK